MVAIKNLYASILKEKYKTQVIDRKDYPAGDSEYLRRLSAVVELERFIAQCEHFSTDASAMITLKKEIAVTCGLFGSIINDDDTGSPPVILDDYIMEYKYLYDSMMPDCIEKAIKKLRCLLRFYIMLITPQTPLMVETWISMKEMDLVKSEEELVEKIKQA